MKIAAALIVTALAVRALHAQRPERQREFHVPGLEVSLRAGWQLLVHGGCRYAVPESWAVNTDASRALAPDGSSLSFSVVRITSWSAHKQQVRAAVGQIAVVHEDSDQRLWFEIGAEPRASHYIDVANGFTVCSGVVEMLPATPEAIDTIRTIADSIGPAPEKWPNPLE